MGNYFKQDISEEIFKNKYMINGETSPLEVFKGVSEEISRVESSIELKQKWYKIFLDQLSSGKLIPAGRILANARPNAKMPYYNNCYTIGINDSIDSIYDSLKEDATISKAGGGVGINFSSIRPKGFPLSKGGESSGVISFMKVFNESAKIIMTGGQRRSAHIGILNIDHPEIEDFITAKQGENNGELTQFNISVGITDAFMDAVNKDLDWDLVFDNKVYRTVKAKYLYDLMSGNAFFHNEPGILNLDHVNKYNNGFYMFDIQEVNPCFTGDTMVAVADGRNAVSIKQLAEENTAFEVYSAKVKTQGSRPDQSKWKAEIKKAIAFKSGTKEVIKVNLTDGTSFECTPEHQLALPDGSYIEAQYSEGRELEKFFTFSNKNTEKSYRNINSKSSGFARQYRMMWEFRNGKYDGRTFNVEHIDGDSTNDSHENLELITVAEHKERTKDSWNKKGNPLSRMEKHQLSYQQSLKNIKANASKYRWGETKLAEKLEEFHDQNEKPIQEDLNVYLDDKVFVESLEWTGKVEDVYDLTVEDNHNFYIITNTDDDNYLNCSGVLVHNCGEIVMPPYSLCCLSSINLLKFVKNSFRENAYFDFEEFRETISIGVRFLDNVLDATKYPLQKIEENSKDMRRIGLGFTGLGDMFVMMGIFYGSKESKELSEQIGEVLRNTSYKTSIELAKEKGKFALCDNNQIVKSNFIKMLPDSFQKDILQYGLRNIGLNTIAPTGTTSFSIGQNCSSGIEPIFSLQYDRKIRTGREDETKTETVYDYAWLKLLEEFPDDNYTIDNAPKVFATTFDIDVYDAIDIQAIFQKYIDHSISKTLNLPVGTTIDEYNDLFKYAYEKGLKGFTTFNPDGSMAGVLSTSNNNQEDTKEGIIYHEAPLRPKELECNIHEITVNKDKMLFVVGLLEGKPYEIFVETNNDKHVDTAKHKKGIISKRKKGCYDLLIEGSLIATDLSHTFNKDFLSLARTLSMSLRHGVPLQFIVDQMGKDTSFGSFQKGVSRVLKKYIADGEVVKTRNDACPECGGRLVYADGCKQCLDCGTGFCG